MRYICILSLVSFLGCYDRELANRGKVFGEIDIHDSRFQLKPYEGFDLFIQEWVEHYLMPFWLREPGYAPNLVFLKADTDLIAQEELTHDKGLDMPSGTTSDGPVICKARSRSFTFPMGVKATRKSIYLPMAPDWSIVAIYTFTWFRARDAGLDLERAMVVVKQSKIDLKMDDQLEESTSGALRYLWRSFIGDGRYDREPVFLMRCDVVHCLNCQNRRTRNFVAQTSVEARLVPMPDTS